MIGIAHKQMYRQLQKRVVETTVDYSDDAEVATKVTPVVDEKEHAYAILPDFRTAVVGGTGKTGKFLLPQHHHGMFTSRTVYRYVDYGSLGEFMNVVKLRWWEIKGMPKDWTFMQRDREYKDLKESLYATNVITPYILRYSDAERQKLYQLIMTEQRFGLCWLLSKQVMLDFLTYGRVFLAASIGLTITPYRPTASCITDQTFGQALRANKSVPFVMSLFRKQNVVLKRCNIDKLIFMSLGLKMQTDGDTTPYRITYTDKDKPIGVKNKKV